MASGRQQLPDVAEERRRARSGRRPSAAAKLSEHGEEGGEPEQPESSTVASDRRVVAFPNGPR